MQDRLRVVVVGAGAAGSAAAAAVRRSAPAVDVVVVGAEGWGPYNRTTVNKGLLSGAVDDAGIALPGMDRIGIDWRTGTVARSLDARARIVELSDGSRLAGDAIVLATGAEARALPGPIEDGARERVLTLRTAVDAARLRALIAAGCGRVVVAGAGLIGIETAAVLLGAGCAVTIVDPAARPLARHVGHTVAAWVAAAHLDAGVDLRVETGVTAVRSIGNEVLVELDDGDRVRAGAVVARLGVDPATRWLQDSDLPMQEIASHGAAVLVDAQQRILGRPRLYAAGDLAAVPGPGGVPVRLEHWGAALEQGRVAASSLLADLGVPATAETVDASAPSAPTPTVPSYSTYVHGTKLTVLGWPAAAVTERAILGRVGDPRFALALLDATERVVGAVGVGGARAVNRVRPLIARRAPCDELDSLPDAHLPEAAPQSGVRVRSA